MDKIRPQKWRQLIAFACISSATLGFLMSIADSYSPKVSSDIVSSRLGGFANRFIDLSNFIGGHIIVPYDANTRTITLALNESLELGRIRITYRGLADKDTIKIETIIPNFDREMFFRHQFDAKKAKKGFRLYLDQFELITAKAERIRLRHVSNHRQ